MNEQEIYIAAMDRADPGERQRFLDEACSGHPEIRIRVDHLIRQSRQLGSFLEHSPVNALANDLSVPGHSLPEGDATLLHESQSVDHLANDAEIREPTMQLTPENREHEVLMRCLGPATRENSLGRLGHYEILEVVGRGAFGTVLRAFDDRLQRVVAIKILSPEMASTSPARKRFLREARTSAQVRHENVVAIHAVEDDPIPYLVMEYIPGKTLLQRLDEHGPLDLADVLRLGKQIADGLAAAHTQGLIHRDIKPGNILLEGGMNERVRITDFGLARTADDASLTQSGVIAGTPMYMAPEQVHGQKLDQRADLFSFGSVLYQMISGRPPFRAASTIAVLKRVVDDAPRPIQEIIPEAPAWLCQLIGNLHAKNRDDRYSSAQEVSQLLEVCMEDVKAGRVPKIPAPASIPKQAGDHKPEIAAIRTKRPDTPSNQSDRMIRIAVGVLFIGCTLCLTEATGLTGLASTVQSLAAGSGTLVIEIDDPGMMITVDGKQVTVSHDGVTELTVPPGQHLIAATKDGQESRQELVAISRDQRTVVHMTQDSRRTGESPVPVQNGNDWVQLFNGRDLTGWKTLPELPGQWKVEDGVLMGSSVSNYLFSTRGDFANFHLRGELQVNAAGDAGICFRAPFEFRHGPRAWMVEPATGYEVELYNQPKPRGTLWQIVPAEPPRILAEAVRVPGNPEWTTFELIADGNHFITRVNGHETVNDVDPHGRYDRGHLVLGATRQAILRVRRLEIRELPAPPPSPAPQLRHFDSDEWIDILPLIDPALDKLDMRQTGTNDWQIQNGELVVANADEKAHKLVFPIDADFWPSFECELEFTRTSGDRGFSLNFPTAAGDTPMVFDPPDKPGILLRLGRTGTVGLSERPQIDTGIRTTRRIEVRRQLNGDRVTVWNGESAAGTWTGDRTQLVSITGEGYPHNRRMSLWIHPGNGAFIFHRIRLRMLDWGTAHAIRPVPVAAAASAPATAGPPTG